MGELACLPHLPLPPSAWSLLRASVSLHVSGDNGGSGTLIIQHNALLQFVKSMANSLNVSWRKCDRFLSQATSLFASDLLPNHYKIDVVVCMMDELGIPLTSDQWTQVKLFLRTHVCRRVGSNQCSGLPTGGRRRTGSRSRSRTSASTSALGSDRTISGSGGGPASSSSDCQAAEVVALRALVGQLQGRNNVLQNMLDSKNERVLQLQGDKRLLQQKVRRMKATQNKLHEKLQEGKQTSSTVGDFSLARVKTNNPGKWSWLMPLGKINVAVPCC